MDTDHTDKFAQKSIDKGLFFVAFKLLLRNQNRLLVTHDIFGEWDLPGGRMKPHEFGGSVTDVIHRKMIEELGQSVEYELGEPKVFFQVERIDAGTKHVSRIFAVGFEATYLAGDIVLGEHHDKFEWLVLNDFKPEDYFTGGWLKGIKEYLS